LIFVVAGTITDYGRLSYFLCRVVSFIPSTKHQQCANFHAKDCGIFQVTPHKS